jgi:CRISPR-associated protein Csm4
MKTRCYRLTLHSALHQGVQGFAREGTAVTVPSDTLFSALVVSWSRLGVDVDGWLAPYLAGEPPLHVTSTFPYAGDVRFYPRPLLRHRYGATGGDEKARRGYRWVSEALFNRLVQGDEIDVPTTYAQQRALWMTESEKDRLPAATYVEEDRQGWRIDTRPRVSIDRITNASQIYHVGRVQYVEQCGLWFAARAQDAQWFERLEQSLDVLADVGLGGLRSVGHGAFTWERWSEAHVPGGSQDESEYALTLARYAPLGEDEIARTLLAPRALYHLRLVGGWSPGDQGARRRKSVRMVTEGSLLRQPLAGQLVDVTPDIGIGDVGHPIYRYGFAFPVAAAPTTVPAEEEVVYG